MSDANAHANARSPSWFSLRSFIRTNPNASASEVDGRAISSARVGLVRERERVDAKRSTSTTEGKTSKEELGRATWMFLHTFAAQYPDEPTRRQEKDARDLISALTRTYPCAECAEHFEAIVRAYPPDCSSGLALQRWMCEVHNEVNASLGKAMFNCDEVGKRWSVLDCGGEAGESGCSLEGRRKKVMSMRAR